MLLIGSQFLSLIQIFMFANRADSGESNLKVAAYEAINEFILSAENSECINVIHALVPVFLARLEKTFAAQVMDVAQRVCSTQLLL